MMTAAWVELLLLLLVVLVVLVGMSSTVTECLNSAVFLLVYGVS